MRPHSTHALLTHIALWAALCALTPAVVSAAPPNARVADDRAALDRAIAQLDEARRTNDDLTRRIADNSRALDELVNAEDRAEDQLNTRVNEMYRTGEATFVAVLVNATTYESFASGWALLKRINTRDAAAIRELKHARARTGRMAARLLELQTAAAKQAERSRQQVAAARTRLAGSQAALRAYERALAAAPPTRRAAASSASSEAQPAETPRGSGAWKSAVASHYSRGFTGTGASGERIGPYSMICAHKTLPFGTLVEFEYRGRRAIARVADRGPYTAGRTFDLGPGIVRALDFEGVQSISYRVIGR